MKILPSFFVKGVNFGRQEIACLIFETFQNGATLKGKNLHLEDAKIISLKSPLAKGGRYFYIRVMSLRDVSVPLNVLNKRLWTAWAAILSSLDLCIG